MVGNGNIGKAAISNIGAAGNTPSTKETEAKAPVAAIAGIVSNLKGTELSQDTSYAANSASFASGDKSTAVEQFV